MQGRQGLETVIGPASTSELNGWVGILSWVSPILTQHSKDCITLGLITLPLSTAVECVRLNACGEQAWSHIPTFTVTPKNIQKWLKASPRLGTTQTLTRWEGTLLFPVRYSQSDSFCSWWWHMSSQMLMFYLARLSHFYQSPLSQTAS